MKKTIEAWIIIDERDRAFTEAKPNWGRYWIFETQEDAKKAKDSFSDSGNKIIRIEIKI